MNYIIEFIQENLNLVYILILAIFIGVELIKNVPSVLHTPLMSGANALSGVVIVGALLVMLQANPEDYLPPNGCLVLARDDAGAVIGCGTR